jgi:hypothetical protein
VAKFVESLQGCFLHEALQKLFKELNSMKNSGCHGKREIFFTKICKKTEKARDKIFGMKYLLVDVYQVC